MPRSITRAKPQLRYVVATPRLLKGKQPSAIQMLEQAEGIEIAGSANPNRIVVRADERSIAKLRHRYGKQLIIEPEIEHFTSD